MLLIVKVVGEVINIHRLTVIQTITSLTQILNWNFTNMLMGIQHINGGTVVLIMFRYISVLPILHKSGYPITMVQDGIIKTLFTLITITEICLKNRQVTRQAMIFQMFRNGYSTEKSKIVLHKLLTI